jgi:serine protease AprX
MRKIYSSIFVLVLVVVIFFAFKPTTGKFGPRLTTLLDNSNQENFTVWVYFKDKGPNAEQMLSNPLNLVTQRSIDRRLKVKSPENVVDMTDVPVYQNYVDVLTPHLSKVRARVKWLNAISIELTRDQLDDIANKDFVNMIEVVEKYKKNKDLIECDEITEKPEISIVENDHPLADTLSYGTGTALSQITQIKVNLVHNQGIYGQGIMIASFDAGFSNYTNHEVFTTLPMTRRLTFDFETRSSTLTAHSHGLATLSLVGGYKPGKLIGPSFKSSFLLARTEVDPTETPREMDHWIEAAGWADSLGADVITSSLGYLTFDSPYPGYTWQDMNGNTMPITKAADLAVNKGIVVSNSAGNNGSAANNTLNGPADGDSVLTVGAVTTTGTRASFSSIGPTTDVPPRIKPDVMALGNGNYTASPGTTTYSTGSGTSFSCPLTSGVVGLVLSANRSLTPMQVVRILRKFASNSSSPNNQMGWGIIDASLAVDSARKLDNLAPVITHTQPFSNTSSTQPVLVKAKITENGIIRFWPNESPRCWFRKSTDNGVTWTGYNFVNNSYYNNIDSFYFYITGSPAGTRVEYFFAAQDIALPTPKMATLPAGGAGTNPPGTTAPPTRFMYTVSLTGIEANKNLPNEYKLSENYPNPFNPVTKIMYQIPNNGHVSLKVFDILGKEIAVLVNEELKAGYYEASFDGLNFPSGIYFYKLETNGFADTKKMILIK